VTSGLCYQVDVDEAQETLLWRTDYGGKGISGSRIGEYRTSVASSVKSKCVPNSGKVIFLE